MLAELEVADGPAAAPDPERLPPELEVADGPVSVPESVADVERLPGPPDVSLDAGFVGVLSCAELAVRLLVPVLDPL